MTLRREDRLLDDMGDTFVHVAAQGGLLADRGSGDSQTRLHRKETWRPVNVLSVASTLYELHQ